MFYRIREWHLHGDGRKPALNEIPHVHRRKSKRSQDPSTRLFDGDSSLVYCWSKK